MKRRLRVEIFFAIVAFLMLLGCAHAPPKAQSNANDSNLLAQFGGSSANTNAANSNAASANASQTAAPANSNVDNFAQQSGVSNSDLVAVSSALKSRSESQLIQAASQVLSRDSNQLQTLNALAIYYYETQRYGMAKILLERALKAHPQTPALYNNLGVIYMAQGQTQRAVTAFKKSLQIKSDYQTGETNVSPIFVMYHDYSLGLSPLQRSYEQTQSDLSQGTPYAVSIANDYAVALMGLGKYSKAKRVFSEIMKSGQQNPVPLLNYAVLLVEVLKKKKDAIQVISKLKFMTEDPAIERRVSFLEQQLESQQ